MTHIATANVICSPWTAESQATCTYNKQRQALDSVCYSELLKRQGRPIRRHLDILASECRFFNLPDDILKGQRTAPPVTPAPLANSLRQRVFDDGLLAWKRCMHVSLCPKLCGVCCERLPRQRRVGEAEDGGRGEVHGGGRLRGAGTDRSSFHLHIQRTRLKYSYRLYRRTGCRERHHWNPFENRLRKFSKHCFLLKLRQSRNSAEGRFPETAITSLARYCR
eukprot:2275046-Pleurochrysis_carterae.AAC.6